MGVYIKGMEMPASCFECKLLDYTDTYKCRVRFESLAKEHGINISRPNWCPLAPVPPHCRLIDADARVNVQMYNDEFEDFQTVNMSIDDLLDSSWIELEDDPTIIPASGGKEDE